MTSVANPSTSPAVTETGAVVRRLVARHPDWDHDQIAERAGCRPRAVRRYMAAGRAVLNDLARLWPPEQRDTTVALTTAIDWLASVDPDEYAHLPTGRLADVFACLGVEVRGETRWGDVTAARRLAALHSTIADLEADNDDLAALASPESSELLNVLDGESP